MTDRSKKLRTALTQSMRVAGKIVEDGKDSVTLRMGGYLLDVPRESIIGEEKSNEGTVILNLKPETEILMTSAVPVEEMIGALSSKIVKGNINPATECCDCTECSYCIEPTDCSDCITPECSYCTSRGWPIKMRTFPPAAGFVRFRKR